MNMYAQAGHSVPKPLFTPGHNPSQQEVNWVGTHSNRLQCMPLADTKLLGRPLPRYWPAQSKLYVLGNLDKFQLYVGSHKKF